MEELLFPLPPPSAPDIALYFFHSLFVTVKKVADCRCSWGSRVRGIEQRLNPAIM